MPLQRNPFTRLKGEKLDVAVQNLGAKGFCYMPFPTIGQGRVPVPVWPPAIPRGWPPLRRSFQLAFNDAFTTAAAICSGQPKCPNVLLLNPPALIIRFFRELVFQPLPPPNPPIPIPAFPFNILICVVVAFWMCVEEQAPPPNPPELPDEVPEIEDAFPVYFAQ